MSQLPTIYCDNIQSVGLHNGNARIVLTRLNAEGRPVQVLELILPQGEIHTLVDALQKIPGRK